MESNDVIITDILGSSMGVSFQMYVMLNGGNILDCDSLFAAVQVQDKSSENTSCMHVILYSYNSTEWIRHLQ